MIVKLQNVSKSKHTVTYRCKFATRSLEVTLNVTGSTNGSPSSGEQIFVFAELYKSSISFTF